MIDFNRENFSEENRLEDLKERLAENIGMQNDCKIEIEKCKNNGDIENQRKTEETLKALEVEAENLRNQIDN